MKETSLFKISTTILAVVSLYLIYREGIWRFDALNTSFVLSLALASVLSITHFALIFTLSKGRDEPYFDQIALKKEFFPVLISAVKEEVIFRGVITTGLAIVFGGFPAIVFSALLFAVFHGKDPATASAFWFSLALGVGLAFSMLLTGDLLFPIVAHAGFNWFAITVRSRQKRIS